MRVGPWVLHPPEPPAGARLPAGATFAAALKGPPPLGGFRRPRAALAQMLGDGTQQRVAARDDVSRGPILLLSGR
jgi:hypothetical protein